LKFLAAPGALLEEFMEFFSKESSLMRRFFPRRWGAPVAIVLYYLFKKNAGSFRTGNIEASHAPPPSTGAGLAQGGQPNLMKQVFYRTKK